ncbi:hypothetical protein M0R04_16180 [Candidatus Dojkabacteria bacterium]|jgi:hypothetical protein|nr:hypothetical protein [Candidatus Dojkabacteria bacterium]
MRKSIVFRSQFGKFLAYLIIATILILGITTIFSRCTPGKDTTKSQEPKSLLQEVKKPKLVPWTQDLDENIVVGDPINLYNQYKIVVEGVIPLQVVYYIDGRRAVRDTSLIYNFNVPQETKGKIKKIIYKNGKPSNFVIQLDEIDSLNYNHTFYLQSNKEFYLGSKTNIAIDGIQYSVKIAIDGDGSGKNRLMHDPLYDNDEKNVGRPASGVPNEIGTKIIKKNR